eukprot:751511-Hanusia_phi.AAC.5
MIGESDTGDAVLGRDFQVVTSLSNQVSGLQHVLERLLPLLPCLVRLCRAQPLNRCRYIIAGLASCMTSWDPAERSGLPVNVVNRARSLLAGHQEVLGLVEEVEEKRARESQVKLVSRKLSRVGVMSLQEIAALELRVRELEASLRRWEEKIVAGAGDELGNVSDLLGRILSTSPAGQGCPPSPAQGSGSNCRRKEVCSVPDVVDQVEEVKEEALRKEELAWGLESEDLELSLSLFYEGAEVKGSRRRQKLRNLAGERIEQQAQDDEKVMRC